MRIIRGGVRGLALAAIMAGSGEAAYAAEAGPLNWGPGRPDIYFGAPPPVPGLFLINHTGFLNTTQNNGPNGSKSTVANFTQNGVINVTRFLAVWPVDLGGLKIATQLVVPVDYVKTSFKSFPLSGSASGFDNVGVTQIFDYTLGKFHHVGGGLDVALKSGSYQSSKIFNPAPGYGSYMPFVHYNYLDPNGLDAGFMARWILNQKNGATNFRSGNLFAVDFKAVYKIGKWKVGGSGGYITQYEDDKAGGVAVANNRHSRLVLGPQIAYDFGPVTVSASYQFTVSAKNAPVSNVAWLTLAMPLYVPPPPARSGIGKP